MATSTPLRSLIPLIFFAILQRGLLLGLIAVPVQASTGFIALPDEGRSLVIAWFSTPAMIIAIIAGAVIILSLLVWLVIRLVKRRRSKKVFVAEGDAIGAVDMPALEASEMALTPVETPAPETGPVELIQPDAEGTAISEPSIPPAALEIALPSNSLDLSGETQLCPRCSETIMVEALFCPYCGVRIGAQAGQPARSEIPTQPVQRATPARLAAQPAYAYQSPYRSNDWPIILLAGGMLVLLCCITAAVVGWWQRERIPLLSGLLSTPTSTPRPTSTRRPASTHRLTPTRRPTPLPPTEPPIVITATTASHQARKLCLLPAGNIDDHGFNALAWNGVQSAAAQYGVQSIYLEARGFTDADFRSALDQLIPRGCDLIVGVGQLTAEAIRQTASTYPQQKFLLLDASLDPPLLNVWSQTYASDQGAFLAGYLAASVSRTGKVGTFGGMDIPVVRTYMNGFTAGVSYYNAMHNTAVMVLGWDIVNQTGLFANDFNSAQQGQILAKQLFNQGADILFPVAGPTGYGAAAEASTRSGRYVIGVDNDWVVARPDYAAVMLTSVEKRLDVSIFLATAAIGTNTFQGGEHIGTLATEISLAPFHNLDWLVSDSVRAELDQVKADIIAGKINTQSLSEPVSAVRDACQEMNSLNGK